MSNKDDKASQTPGEGTEEAGAEPTETPRAKTPLEMVRERQAQMRGQQTSAKHSSSKSDLSGPADSYKRRMRQRKSG